MLHLFEKRGETQKCQEVSWDGDRFPHSSSRIKYIGDNGKLTRYLGSVSNVGSFDDTWAAKQHAVVVWRDCISELDRLRKGLGVRREPYERLENVLIAVEQRTIGWGWSWCWKRKPEALKMLRSVVARRCRSWTVGSMPVRTVDDESTTCDIIKQSAFRLRSFRRRRGKEGAQGRVAVGKEIVPQA